MLEPAIEALGFELVDTELSGSGRRALLRIYIDRPGGVNVDDCAAVSHQVSAILDVEDPIAGRYTLEVSSPGLDRPLTRPQDFERFAGELVAVKLARPRDGRRKFKGRLLGLRDGMIALEADGERFDLAFDEVDKVRLVPTFE
jgi:ribosome maturation factor RimP